MVISQADVVLVAVSENALVLLSKELSGLEATASDTASSRFNTDCSRDPSSSAQFADSNSAILFLMSRFKSAAEDDEMSSSESATLT